MRGRLRLYFGGCGDGFGRVYSASGRLTQAGYPPEFVCLRICQRWQRGLSGKAAAIGPDLMSAVQPLEARHGGAPLRADAEPAQASSIEAQLTRSAARGRARLRPLLALVRYVARYRGRAVLAFIALTVAAVTTLIVPVAARRMIDFGFSPEGIALINSYFSVMILMVAVLAGASASRFYLVMTIGERIVADLRRDVFDHLVSLSPAFFDSARSGELISRLTAHTTQIKSAVRASVSMALRNVMLFISATPMMVVTTPPPSGFFLLAIPPV